MWKAVFDSVKGTSHEEHDTPCQDACDVTTIAGPHTDYLVAVCSDGAGSAPHSHIGAKLACDNFLKIAQEVIESEQLTPDLTREDAVEWLIRIRQELEAEATSLELPIRDLACTLLCAVIGDETSVFIQVGDGAMIIDTEEECNVVFWPQSGEYSNMTNFLTGPDLDQSVEFAVRTGRISNFASFTDGLERLILRFADRSVHRPFLTPLFDYVRNSDNIDSLFAPLHSFLSSERVNARTDDDKTLILATRVQGQADGDPLS